MLRLFEKKTKLSQEDLKNLLKQEFDKGYIAGFEDGLMGRKNKANKTRKKDGKNIKKDGKKLTFG